MEQQFCHKWTLLDEVIEGNLVHCREILRMDKHELLDLCNILYLKGGYKVVVEP